MKIFLTGATGYIGGMVAARLLGMLADRAVVADAAGRADAVINAANSDNRDSIEAVLPVLEGSSKPFIQTSGSSIVGDKAGGELGTLIYDEETPVKPLPEKAPRVAINDAVLAAAQKGVRAIVLCPSLIYGTGAGIHKESVQVPRLIALAKESGVPRHVGPGENIWSHVHIDDVAALFLLALDKAPAGSFFYVENGEATMKSVAQAISRMLSMVGTTEEW